MAATGTEMRTRQGTGSMAARVLLVLAGVLIILGLVLPEFPGGSFIDCNDEVGICVATTLEHGSPLIPVVIALVALGRGAGAVGYARGLALAAGIGAVLIFGAHLAYPFFRNEPVGLAVYPGLGAGVVLFVAVWRLRSPA
ncbi:MAG TPA: hypothetical protein VHL78_13765 [Actinomycetota bacterium]|nr:hypothetical protein [Actinomycetota bacterium]